MSSLHPVAACAASLLLTGCGDDELEPVGVLVPQPTVSPASEACAALETRLPATIDGEQRRDSTPESQRTAAWGNPAVVMRCGVPQPSDLTATSYLHTVNGVDWHLAEHPDLRVFTTVGRVANIEVQIPREHDPAVGPLVDLATPILGSVPADPDSQLPLPTP